jgi:hypothetical protein
MGAIPADRLRDVDERVYALARSYLLGREGITRELLDRHVCPSSDTQKPTTLSAIYERLLRSAQSAQNMPNLQDQLLSWAASICDDKPRQ